YKLRFNPSAAKSDRSGTSRTESIGTPVPVCQAGLAYPPRQKPPNVKEAQLLGPPPPAVRSEELDAPLAQPVTLPERAHESFHASSGIYDLAEAAVAGSFVAFQ